MKRSYDGTIKVKENVKLEESPGLKPKDVDHSDKWKWHKKYMDLSYEKKILFETQEQTRLIRKISNNVLFYFWLTIISFILYIIVVFLLG
tara:strand:+ start:956 stop:1225 length:270 start_codon:yes stop_codon:yes gene_type:complete